MRMCERGALLGAQLAGEIGEVFGETCGIDAGLGWYLRAQTRHVPDLSGMGLIELG
jgi:hypothetical protein